MTKQQGVELEDLVADQPDEIREKSLKSMEQFGESFRRLQGLSYREWLVDGVPRTSLHLRTAE